MSDDLSLWGGRVLVSIHDYTAHTGDSPTLALVAASTGLSVSSVSLHVSRLARLGYLTARERRKHRTLWLTDAGHMAVDRLRRVSAGAENAEGTR